MIPFSVLDLAPVAEGKTAADALHNSLDLAQNAEHWGYKRYWLATTNACGFVTCARNWKFRLHAHIAAERERQAKTDACLVPLCPLASMVPVFWR